MVKRVMLTVTLVCILLLFMSLPISAEESIGCADEYFDMLDALPDDIAELLPDKLFSDKASDIGEGASEAVSFGYVIDVVARHLGLELKGALKLLAAILGLLILSSLMNSVKTSFSSSGISDAFSVITSCAVLLTAFASEYTIVRSVAVFFERLCLFVNSILPLTATLYAMGGNVASAVVHHSSLMIFIALIENFCAKSAMPVAGICMSLSTVGAVAPDINIGSVSKLFKKTYTQILGFMMTLFVAVMGGQSLLAGKTDTLAGRAAKFAVSNLIPTVGSALSGTLGTVAASVEYIRASIGIIGIVAVILMLIPTLVTLLVTKFTFAILECAADLLGCTAEKKILDELSAINGFLLSLAAIASVSFIFVMTIFAKCSSAAGGGVL